MTRRICQWTASPREKAQGMEMEPQKTNSHRQEKIFSKCKYTFAVTVKARETLHLVLDFLSSRDEESERRSEPLAKTESFAFARREKKINLPPERVGGGFIGNVATKLFVELRSFMAARGGEGGEDGQRG